MKTEFECRICNINKTKTRKLLSSIGAKLVQKEFMQKRYILDNNHLRKDGDQWIRLRDEGNKITLTYKTIERTKIDGAKEIEVIVNDLENTKELLVKTGLKVTSYQENYREKWTFKNCDLTIDTWPMLNPVLEIESKSENTVLKILALLGYDIKDCMFGNITDVYFKNGIPLDHNKDLKFK